MIFHYSYLLILIPYITHTDYIKNIYSIIIIIPVFIHNLIVLIVLKLIVKCLRLLRFINVNISILRLLPGWILIIFNLQIFGWVILIIVECLFIRIILTMFVGVANAFRLYHLTINIILQKLLVDPVLVTLNIALLTRKLSSSIHFFFYFYTASIQTVWSYDQLMTCYFLVILVCFLSCFL